MRLGFDTANINLSHFNPQNYYYPPTGMGVQAFQVTDENIGALVVDFDTDLEYGIEDDLPYFTVRVNRLGADKEILRVKEFDVYLHDWIVFLRGELHFFHEKHFFATFAQANGVYRAAEEQGIAPQWNEAEKAEKGAPDTLLYPFKEGDKKRNANYRMLGVEGVAPLEIPSSHSRVFEKGTRVSTPEHGLEGEVVEGPNGRNEYFVTLYEGGAKWYRLDELRISTPEKTETD